MQSTYSVLSLGRNKTLTVMTSSTSLAPPFTSTTTATKPTTTQTVVDNYLRQSTKIMDKISKSILPLYPQFVYSIRVVSLGESSGESYSQSGDLIEMLNGQSIDASKIRLFPSSISHSIINKDLTFCFIFNFMFRFH